MRYLSKRLATFLSKRLTYANVTATLALFVVLGGTSYAAVALPRNSVKAKQISAGAVTSSEVKDGSLKARDFSRGARKALQGARGPAGPPGPAGAGGTGGGTSAAVAATLTYKTAAGTVAAAPVDETTTAVATARCDAGQRVTGGGVRLQSVTDMQVHDDYPDASGTAWTAHVGNDAQASRTFTVYAICTP